MKIEAISVRPVDKYRIEIFFNDGAKGIYNVSSLAGTPVFKSWDEGDTFFQVFINKENGSIAWSEMMEIDTLNAYLNIKGVSYDDYLQEQRKKLHAIS